MYLPRVTLLSLAVSTVLAFALSGPAAAQQRLDHRSDFRMNSIGGGDFREYISEHVGEDDRWGHALRMFGTFHNHMHEMMTDLALYAAERLGHGSHIPEFENRISGGQWGGYRENLEEAGIESAWRDLVQITEIMHDRVHHAMYKSTVYDRASRVRTADLDDYIGEDRAPYPAGETVLRTNQANTEYVRRDRFREFVWHHDFEDRHFHAAMQKLIVFDEMLHTLMTDWADYGAQKTDASCRPPEFGARITREQWHRYAGSVEQCGEEEWRHFVRVAALMHDRIHHVMHRAMVHAAAQRARVQATREYGVTAAGRSR